MREAFTVQTIARVVKGKKYEEIERMFQYYLLVKEEEQILKAMSSDGKRQKLNTRLQMVRDRKQALKSLLNEKDAEALAALKDTMRDEKVSMLANADLESAEGLRNFFGVLDREQVAETLEKTKSLSKVVDDLLIADQSTPVFAEFRDIVNSKIADACKQAESETYKDKDIPHRNMEKTIERFYRGQTFPQLVKERLQSEIIELN